MSDSINKKEKIVLEYLLSDREVFLKAHSIIQPKYFESPLDRVVKYTKKFFGEYHKIPDFDLIDAETGVELRDRPCDDADREFVLEEVEQHCARAAMVEAIMESADLVSGNREDINLNEVQALVREALTVKLDKNLGTDLFEDPRTRIESAELSVDTKNMGIPKFDELADGWRRKELYFIVAGTSVGKSVALANVAHLFAAQGEDALIFSVEMNEELYSKRLDSIVTGVPIGEPDVDEIVESLATKQEKYGRITTKKVSPKFGIEDMRAFLLEYHMTYGKYPDVCIVDYIDIFGNGASGNKNMNKYDIDELKTHMMRDLMDEFNMRGFTASQLNRDGYGVVDVGPQHVQGGLSKIQGADAAFAFVATEEDMENNQFQVKGIKLRNSNKKHEVITLYRCPKTLRLSDQVNPGKQKPSSALEKVKSQGQQKQNSDEKKSSEPKKTNRKPIRRPGDKKKALEEAESSQGRDRLAKALNLTKGVK